MPITVEFKNPNRNMVFWKFTAILALLTLSQIARADPLDIWTLRCTVPAPSSVFRLFYGNGQFVAVGDGGTILSSADGVSWTQHESGTKYTLACGTCGNGKFVV